MFFDNIPAGPASGDTLVTTSSTQVVESAPAEEPLVQEAAQPEQPIEQEVRQTPQQQNFNKLRYEKERLEQERNEYERRLRELEARFSAKQPTEQEEPVNLKEDEIPEWRHVNKAIDKKYAEIDRRLLEYEQRSAQSALKNSFPDIDKVVTDENLRALRDVDPDIADSILANKNPYSQYAAAYKQIKLHGIYQDDKYVQDKSRAQQNAAKPRPLASMSPQQSESPLSQVNAFANGLTPELRKQLNREMEEAIKRRN